MSIPCNETFEAMAGYVKGTLDRQQSARVEQHLRGCGNCRQLHALLADAGPPPEGVLSSGFAARTAARALRRKPPFWREGFSIPAEVWGRDPHPVTALLQRRRARLAPATRLAALAGPALVFGLPAAVMAAGGWEMQLQGYLVAVLVGLLAGLPWFHLHTDVTLLTSLRRGRCLEELLASGVGSAGIVDALALHSVRSILASALPVLLVLLPGAAAFEAGTRRIVLVALALWIPAMALGFWVGSYALQMLIAWSRDGESAGLLPVGMGLAVLGPGGVALGFAALHAAGGNPAAAWEALVGLLWTAGVARKLAIWALENPRRVDRLNRGGWLGGARSRRSAWVRLCDNPVVARETARRACFPGAWLGRAAGYTGAALLPFAWAIALIQAPLEARPSIVASGALALMLLAFLRAAAGTAGAVVGERERGTLEPLVQSGTPLRDYLSGWFLVGTLPVWLELIPAAGVLGMAAYFFPRSVVGLWAVEPAEGLLFSAPGLALTALMAWVLAVPAGSWTGLAISASSASRREAGGRLVASFFQWSIAWLALWAALHFAAECLAEEWTDIALALSTVGRWAIFDLRLAPLLAAAATFEVALWRGRRSAERSLREIWGAADLGPPGSSPAPLEGPGHRLLALPAALGGVALALLSALWGTLPGMVFVGRGPHSGVYLLAGGAAGLVAAWGMGVLLRPLVMAAIDRFGGSPQGGMALGGVLGAAAGGMIGAVLASICTPAWLSGWLPGVGEALWEGNPVWGACWSAPWPVVRWAIWGAGCGGTRGRSLFRRASAST